MWPPSWKPPSRGRTAAPRSEARNQDSSACRVCHGASVIEISQVLHNKAVANGAEQWLADLPELVGSLLREWSLTLGPAFTGGTEAFVAAVTQADGTPAVLKLLVPRDDLSVHHEILVLQVADGDGCARLFRSEPARNALLIERLGPSLHDLGLPFETRLPILAATAQRVWRPATGLGLTTGAEKGRRLAHAITELWDELDRPCSERVVAHALACAERRIAAHDDERAVLVHGDVHQWNTLQAGNGFTLVDPDGLLAEAEYDLGIIMREDPAELMVGDPRERSRMLAAWTGLDESAIWEWGVVERVSTGLLCVQIGLQPWGDAMLAAAEHVAT